jgi:hypothetical protein
MAKAPKKVEDDQGERIPFDDALRRILAAPPVHKTAAKKPAAKAKKNAR